jgi:hypothetical protein
VDVRLNPREVDFYSWRVIQGKEELYSKIFTKNLSDHSTGTYRLLCREVGKSFKAVPPRQVSTLDSIIPVCQKTKPSFDFYLTLLDVHRPSFSSIIDQLREENARLS